MPDLLVEFDRLDEDGNWLPDPVVVRQVQMNLIHKWLREKLDDGSPAYSVEFREEAWQKLQELQSANE